MPSKFSAHRKSALLGMPLGTAANRLRKILMFELVKKCNLTKCHQCGKDIQTVEELSIEHKNGWQLSKNPLAAYFDIENIGFSHLRCNVAAGTRPTKIYETRREYQRVYESSPDQRAKKKIRNARRYQTEEVAERGGFEPPGHF